MRRGTLCKEVILNEGVPPPPLTLFCPDRAVSGRDDSPTRREQARMEFAPTAAGSGRGRGSRVEELARVATLCELASEGEARADEIDELAGVARSHGLTIRDLCARWSASIPYKRPRVRSPTVPSHPALPFVGRLPEELSLHILEGLLADDPTAVGRYCLSSPALTARCIGTEYALPPPCDGGDLRVNLLQLSRLAAQFGTADRAEICRGLLKRCWLAAWLDRLTHAGNGVRLSRAAKSKLEHRFGRLVWREDLGTWARRLETPTRPWSFLLDVAEVPLSDVPLSAFERWTCRSAETPTHPGTLEDLLGPWVRRGAHRAEELIDPEDESVIPLHGSSRLGEIEVSPLGAYDIRDVILPMAGISCGQGRARSHEVEEEEEEQEVAPILRSVDGDEEEEKENEIDCDDIWNPSGKARSILEGIDFRRRMEALFESEVRPFLRCEHVTVGLFQLFDADLYLVENGDHASLVGDLVPRAD